MTHLRKMMLEELERRLISHIVVWGPQGQRRAAQLREAVIEILRFPQRPGIPDWVSAFSH
jgi:hypothetical protein